MKVESACASDCATQPRGRELDHHVQNVFSEVLAAAGREGYASAEPVAEDQPMAEQIIESWSAWFDGRCCSRATDAEALKQSYGEILVRANEEGGYADPKAFLESLSSEELAVVQHVHSLADPIQVDSLSEEGAVNLLVPPPAQVDLNHDGFTRSGVAYGMKFPDSNTPPSVAQAWEEATEGMSFGELATYQLQMKLPLLTANIVCDENGRFLHQYEPGDPEFTNPMASSDYSYVQATQDRLDYLDTFRYQIPEEQYQEGTAFWTNLQERLIENGAV